MPPEDQGIHVRPGFDLPEGELHFSFTASSGPGGQNVNKNATKVRLKWWPYQSAPVQKCLSPADRDLLFKRIERALAEDGSVQVVSDRYRTRESNRNACRSKP